MVQMAAGLQNDLSIIIMKLQEFNRLHSRQVVFCLSNTVFCWQFVSASPIPKLSVNVQVLGEEYNLHVNKLYRV